MNGVRIFKLLECPAGAEEDPATLTELKFTPEQHP
jgi:hypothetical protein